MKQDALVLTRRDPCRNMARFYALAVEPDLFNGIALTRNWGRIGTMGRFRIELFVSVMDAERRLSEIARSKLKRGYRPTVA